MENKTIIGKLFENPVTKKKYRFQGVLVQNGSYFYAMYNRQYGLKLLACDKTLEEHEFFLAEDQLDDGNRIISFPYKGCDIKLVFTKNGDKWVCELNESNLDELQNPLRFIDLMDKEVAAYLMNGELFFPYEYKPIAEENDGAIALYKSEGNIGGDEGEVAWNNYQAGYKSGFEDGKKSVAKNTYGPKKSE